MKRLILTLVLLLSFSSALASGHKPQNGGTSDSFVLDTQGVALVQYHTLYGLPLGTPESNTLIARPIYCLSNNPNTKFADWVAYRVDSESMKAGVKTKRKWKADPALPENETLEPEDYKGAHAVLHTDRGHQAPLASFKGTKYWHQTNYLSNITPQRSDLNQGPWKQLEDKVRELASKQPVYVMTGPLYERPMEALPGSDEPHSVPSGYWKIIAVQDTEHPHVSLIAYIFNQETERKAQVADHIVTVNEVEARTGLDFFWLLPDEIEETIESSVERP